MAAFLTLASLEELMRKNSYQNFHYQKSQTQPKMNGVIGKNYLGVHTVRMVTLYQQCV